MADRFNGNIHIGGRIPREQYDSICALAEPLLEGDLTEDGKGEFCNCVTEDFSDLVKYCEEHKIALMLHWDGKFEYGPQCEYWINGKYQHFIADSSGRIVITVAELETKAKDHPKLTVLDFIETLDIPVFPEFSIGDDQPAPDLLPADKPRYLTPAGLECTIIRENEHSVTLLIADNGRKETYEWTTDRPNFEKRYPLLRSVTLYFSDGKSSTNVIVGDGDDDIANHFLGKPIESGSDSIALCVHFNDTKEKLGLKVKNIESGDWGQIVGVRQDEVKITDDESYSVIMLELLCGNEFALNDCWVYGRDDAWIKTVGYRHQFVQR